MDPILWNRDVISCLFWGTFLSAESEMKSDYSRSYGGSSSGYSASLIFSTFSSTSGGNYDSALI